MKMRGTGNRYGTKRALAEFEAKTMKAEQDFERQAGMPGLSKMFGKLADEYAIYKACAPAPHKSFDEWLES
jgi:hypothetical protein